MVTVRRQSWRLFFRAKRERTLERLWRSQQEIHYFFDLGPMVWRNAD